ncbi:hypothetical protein, partial [Micromonospora noduli]|uniref:hypothetical protein n=1 Tax=Micromonospora noduli TaxID=709876 RepID=UPI001B860BE3
DSEIRELKVPCGENREIFAIGLDVTDRIWYTLIAVCFDFGIKLAFCSNHVLNGKGLSIAQGPYKVH